MLLNTNNFLSPVQSALTVLQHSKFEFCLTGSRFFGGAREESDWDFITWFNQETEDFLVWIGFVLNEDVQDYLDPMTTKVLTKHFCHCDFRGMEWGEKIMHTDECLKIDIQLCHDFSTKIKVRDILKKSFNRPLPGDKYQRSQLWSMVYELVKAKE